MKKRYSIGEVSKITSIPIKALRNYDSMGLVKPFQKDEKSLYRYYSYEQFFRLDLIRYMNKSLHIPLDIIKLMLEEGSQETMLHYLEQHKAVINEKKKMYEYAYSIVDKEIASIKDSRVPSRTQGIFEQYLLKRTVNAKKVKAFLTDIDRYLNRNEASKLFKLNQENPMCFIYDRSKFCDSDSAMVDYVGIIDDFSIYGYEHVVLPEGRYLCCRFKYSESQSIEALGKLRAYADSKGIRLDNSVAQVFNICDLSVKSKNDFDMEIQVHQQIDEM